MTPFLAPLGHQIVTFSGLQFGSCCFDSSMQVSRVKPTREKFPHRKLKHLLVKIGQNLSRGSLCITSKFVGVSLCARLQFNSISIWLFVYLFVCTSRLANFAKGKWSDHDSENCSEIRTVRWSVIWLWKLQFTILIFFDPL